LCWWPESSPASVIGSAIKEPSHRALVKTREPVTEHSVHGHQLTSRRSLRHYAWRRQPAAGRRGSARAKVIGGGTDGNEQLTATVGTILLVLLVVMGVTILRLHQLIAVHQFVGVLLVGPLALKATSTGYRFTRYYTGDPAYRRKGPPERCCASSHRWSR